MKRIVHILFLMNCLLSGGIFAQSTFQNQMEVNPGFVYPVNAWDPLQYTIRFQNTTQDTLYALTLSDALPSQLDTSSFIMTASSHPYTVSLNSNGLLTWVIGPVTLPPAGQDSLNSTGFLEFEIIPKPSFYPGDTILNTVQIQLDSTTTLSTPLVKYYQKNPWTRLDMIRRVTCHNGQDAHVRITTLDFGPGLEYSLDSLNWQSSPDFYNVSNGTYQGHARDSLGNYDISLGIWLPNAQPFQPGIFLVNDTFSTGLWTTYQWNLNQTPIPGATNRIWKPVSSGYYSVTVTDTNGCTGQSEDSLYTYVFREPIQMESQISIVPNPNDGLAELMFPTGKFNQIEIWDVYGKCHQVFFLNQTADQLSLNLPLLPKGYYWIIAKQGDWVVASKKWLKG